VTASSAYPLAVFGPFHPHRGGIAHHTTLLAETLAQDHPVLGIGFKRLYPGFLFPGRTQLDHSAAPLVPRGVRVEPIVDCIGPHTWLQAATALRGFGAKLLIVQWWHPFFAPACATIAAGARRAGARVLFLCHNVLPHERSAADLMLIKWGLGAADGFLVQSQTDFDVLGRLYPSKPRELTPHPAYTFFEQGKVAPEAARAKLGVQAPVVLFFGLVRAYKGLDVLLRAVAVARRTVPLTLVVAGEFYQERGPYDALITELGLAGSVVVHDRYIANEDVETYFRAADVVVLPYVSATQSGIAQIALSFERPVIVTRVGGLPEAVRDGETGRVVPPRDPEALGAALVEFCAPGAGARYAPHLKGEAERFSWAAMAGAVDRAAGALGLPAKSGLEPPAGRR
jgi:glycosyltransferase involved in cell wall biosynthesis